MPSCHKRQLSNYTAVASNSAQFLLESIDLSFFPTPIPEPLLVMLLQRYFAKLDCCAHFQQMQNSKQFCKERNRELNLLCQPQRRFPGNKHPSSLGTAGPHHPQVLALNV